MGIVNEMRKIEPKQQQQRNKRNFKNTQEAISMQQCKKIK